MHLQTKRLILRNFADDDLEAFVAYRNDPQLAKYQGWKIPYSRDQGRDFIASVKELFVPVQGQWVQIAIALRETNELIGDIGCFVKHEDVRQAIIGYRIASRFWRRGYALEAILRWLEYLFDELDMHRVTADCDTENTASFRLLEKIGFRREAEFIESYPDNGRYTNEYHYGLLQREWRAITRQKNTTHLQVGG